MVMQVFTENTDYSALRMELVTMTDHSATTGYSCEGQLIDNDGDRWFIDFSIRHSATDSTEFVVTAQWRLIG